VAEIRFRSLDEPDETIELPGVVQDEVELGDLAVGRVVHEPGWRWSTHVKPEVGGEWCQARHVGIVLSGRLGILLEDGTTAELGPNDVYEIPPGHDGYVIGHEPAVVIEWAGLRAFTGFRGSEHRVLATLLVTAVADAAAIANRLGGGAWRELISSHIESTRAALDRCHGEEVSLSGEGLLATFDGPADALRCAEAIHAAATRNQLGVRAAVHVGEVELAGEQIRGAALLEADQIMEHAEAGETLVSETTRALALAAGMSFEERGTHELEGVPGEWRLFAYLARTVAR
jgi:class 3 adenylate cyclase